MVVVIYSLICTSNARLTFYVGLEVVDTDFWAHITCEKVLLNVVLGSVYSPQGDGDPPAGFLQSCRLEELLSTYMIMILRA